MWKGERAMERAYQHTLSLAIASILHHKGLSDKLSSAIDRRCGHGSARYVLEAKLGQFPVPEDHPPMPLNVALWAVLADREMCAALEHCRMQVMEVRKVDFGCRDTVPCDGGTALSLLREYANDPRRQKTVARHSQPTQM
jgi:hypothetical protein